MAGIINMKHIRYINLFSKVSSVKANRCFIYNGKVFFVVPPFVVSKAIGKNAMNMVKLSKIIRKKIKVIPMPGSRNKECIKKFIEDIVEPVDFNKIELKDNNLTINARKHSKAALIGRNRRREKELEKIIKDFFGITKLRII